MAARGGGVGHGLAAGYRENGQDSALSWAAVRLPTTFTVPDGLYVSTWKMPVESW